MSSTMSNTIGNVYGKISAVSADLLTGIEKSRTSGGEGSKYTYKYRGIEDFVNAVAPLLVKHGLVILPTVRELATSEIQTPGFKPGEIKVTYTHSGTLGYTVISTDDGSSITGFVPVHALDNSDKGANKCASYGFRTFLAQTFCVPFDDMSDGEEEDIRITRAKTEAGEGSGSNGNVTHGENDKKVLPKEIAEHRVPPGDPVINGRKVAPSGHPVAHWIDDERARKNFWQSAANLVGKDGTEERVKNILGVVSMHDYTGTAGDALTKIKQHVEAEKAKA